MASVTMVQRSPPTRTVGPAGPRRLLLLLIPLLAGPLLVAVIVQRSPGWYPSLELAETELHVRDVGTGDTPATGLIGRLGPPEARGSHPGPAAFYALAPVYRLLGSSPGALQASTAVTHLAAVAVALWISHRRGGNGLLLLTAALLAALLRAYGAEILTEPWSPYVPVLWWVVVILAVWSVIDGDVALLPVAVAAGSLCVQSHISYAGLVAGLGAAAVVVMLARRRQPVPWPAVAVVVGAAMWLPPALDQLFGDGNASVVMRTFTDPPGPPIGVRRGVELVLAELDPFRLLAGRVSGKVGADPSGWPVAGLALIAAWAASWLLARRLGHRSLGRLHLTLGLALVLAAASASRIHGPTWRWLLLWASGLTALLLVAMVWTAALVLIDRRPSLRGAGVAALAVLTIGSALALTVDATQAEPDDLKSSRAVAELVPEVMDGIDGHDGRLLVTWTDPVGIIGDAVGFGLVNELDRRGVPIGISPALRLRAAPHLTLERSEAAAVLILATGDAITEMDADAQAERIAFHDPRSPDQRSRQAELLREIDEAMLELGLDELRSFLDTSFFGAFYVAQNDPAVPAPLIEKMREVLAMGAPSAVFLKPG